MRVVLVVAVLVLAIAVWLTRTDRGAGSDIVTATPQALELPAGVELGNPLEEAATTRTAGGEWEAGALEFRVVDDATGAAIERFALLLAEEDRDDAVRRLEFHPHGVVRRARVAEERVKVYALGYESAVLHVNADASGPLTIRMRRAGGIQGVVRLAGAPVDGAIVYEQREADAVVPAPAPVAGFAYPFYEDEDSGQEWVKQYAHGVAALPRFWNAFAADGKGQFEIPGARTGVHALRFEAPGAASQLRLGVRVTNESVLDLGVVDLEREAVVRGVLVPPLDVAPTEFALDLDGGLQLTRTTADGTFEFRGLASGAHRISWRRSDTRDSAMHPALRRTDFELVAGETRELVIDATGSGTFDLTVRVSLGGKPAPNYDVRATPRDSAYPRTNRWSGREKTGDDGVALLRMKPGEEVFVEVLDGSGHLVGRSTQPIEMQAAGEGECKIELEFGTLVVDLPWELARAVQAEHGVVAIEHWDAAAHSLGGYLATTEDPPESQATAPKWTGRRIDFGAFRPGAYRVVLTFGGPLPGSTQTADGFAAWKLLREDFETNIVVRARAQTLIVVP